MMGRYSSTSSPNSHCVLVGATIGPGSAAGCCVGYGSGSAVEGPADADLSVNAFLRLDSGLFRGRILLLLD